jgi:Transposase Tn5 dimerisation domain/Transposase DNA-binding
MAAAERAVPISLGELDPPDLQGWLDEELRTIHLGDQRLNRRCQLILHRLARHPNFKFNSACRGDSEMDAAYQFVNNRHFSEQDILRPHTDATYRRIRQHQVALLVNDTTENDLTRPNERMAGAGPLSDPGRWGLFVHPLMAFTPQGVPLGLCHVHIWARDPQPAPLTAKEKDRLRKNTPIQHKESFRWIHGYRQACLVASACPDTQVVYVADSEADIFELFHEARPAEGACKASWLVRACYDRAVEPLVDGEEAPEGRLLAEVAATAVLATLQVQVSQRPARTGDGRKRKQARQARTATLSVQARRVKLRVPGRTEAATGAGFAGMTHVEVNVVLVREVNPPAGEEAIEWLLLSSLPIDTLEQVLLVVEYYCRRWQIEIYFRVLKSGCEVEKSQLETAGRYKRYLALCLIVAWRVMYLMMLGRRCPDMPCDAVLQEDEWQAVYAVVKQEAPPSAAPSLGVMLLLLATLGGYLGRPSDGEPGPKAIWRGMQRMADLVAGWRAAKAALAGQGGEPAPAAGAEPSSQQASGPTNRDNVTRGSPPPAPTGAGATLGLAIPASALPPQDLGRLRLFQPLPRPWLMTPPATAQSSMVG